MGLRFQRRVSLFPGVRLNFSRSGISTSIGVRGASLTLGRRGTYVNVGLPGTGLSYRSKISPEVSPAPASEPRPNPDFGSGISRTTSETEVVSADVGTLTSPGLDGLKSLIIEAIAERNSITKKVRRARRHARARARRLWVARLFVIRLFMQRWIPYLARAAFEAMNALHNIETELAACVIDVDFGLDDATLAKFEKSVCAFESLQHCDKIWDVTSTSLVDRYHERTTAWQAVKRKTVRFELTNLPVIRSSNRALHLENANGNDLLIYPGFAMIRRSESDFALVDVRDLQLLVSSTRFIEEDTVPEDSAIVGQTWKKANKDGSRDRRFNGNYQIPIVQYGELHLSSRTGLNEIYMTSSYPKASEFAAAWEAYQQAAGQEETRPLPPLQEIQETNFNDKQDVFVPPASPRTLIYDWIALPVIVLAMILAGPVISEGAVSLYEKLSSLDRPVGLAASSIKSAVAASSAKLNSLPVVYIRSPTANVRQLPSVSSRIIRQAHRGDKFMVLEKQDEWIHVGDGNPIGWVRQDLVTTTAP